MAYLDKNHPRLSYVCQCGLLSLNRSSTYYKPKETAKEDLDLINEIRDIWEKRPFYGYRRIKVQLERQGTKANHKRVLRLMNEAGLQAIYPKPKTSRKNVAHRTYPYRLQNLELEHSNQVEVPPVV